jgi:hypothetical protein
MRMRGRDVGRRSSAGVEDSEASQIRDGIEFVAIFRGANVFRGEAVGID